MLFILCPFANIFLDRFKKNCYNGFIICLNEKSVTNGLKKSTIHKFTSKFYLETVKTQNENIFKHFTDRKIIYNENSNWGILPIDPMPADISICNKSSNIYPL